jgi:hypothetical protein
MATAGYAQTLITAQSDGTSRASFTTAITILPDHARWTIPAGYFFIGKKLRVTASGRISNVVTAQPTFQFLFKLGPTSNITVFDGGNMTTSTTAHTTVPWSLEIDLTCRAVGAGTTATLMGQGRVWSRAFVVSGATADSVNTHTTLMIPATTPAVGGGFDSTVANIADLFAACGTSDPANLIQLHQYSLEDLY